MNFAWRIYQRLAQAFPHEFKLAYGTEVMRAGEDVIEDIAQRRGALGLIRFIADIAIRVPLEYLSEMRGDMRYAVRGLRKSPGFALVGIISMGLGIGLTTNVYSSKWAVLIRDLPAAANAKHLVMLQASADGDLSPESYYYIERFREQKNLFTGVAAFETGIPFNVTFQGNLDAKPERIFGQLVSPDYFSVLGVQPQIGRVFSAEQDKAGDAPVVVISDRFWRRRFHSSPEAVGQALRLNGQIATIVGITPKDFHGAIAVNPSELFVPITAPASLAPELANDVLHQPQARDFLALMCLAPGVTIESAEAALDTITRRLDEQDPSWLRLRTDKGRRVTLLPAGTSVPIPRKLKPALIGFFVALMGLIVALACMNLVNMLLARGANRRKELAIRLSVGASRFRLVRQMMSEGILLSLLGGVAGFALACGLGVLNAHFTAPTTLPIPDLYLDWHAAAFALGLALVCGVGFTLVPAWQATKADLTPALKQGLALPLPGYRRLGLRNLLMLAQVAASLMLLLMTGFLVIGISKSTSIATKFAPNSMYLLSLDPVRDGYRPDKAQALFERLPEQLKTVPGVRKVALAGQPPFSSDGETTPLSAEDAPGSAPLLQPVLEETVGAGYFAAFSEPMLAGREFVEADQRSHPDGSQSLPAVLNESAARRFFGSGNAIGKRVRDDKHSFEVIGLVADLKDVLGLSQSILYLPLTAPDFARPPAGGLTVLVRADEGTDALRAVQNEIAVIDPHLNAFNVQTLAAYLDRSRAALRFSVQTYGGIGVFGLVLAAIGLAGVTAYAVAQRRNEIAIRAALGASRAQVLSLVMREGTALVGGGTVLGFLGAIGLAKIASALANIFSEALQVGTNDPRLLVGAPLLLAGVALLACYVPARRATKIDPMQALRQE